MWTALWEGVGLLRTGQGSQALLYTLSCQPCFWVCIPAVLQEFSQATRVLGRMTRRQALPQDPEWAHEWPQG